jgi:hypothetical protein
MIVSIIKMPKKYFDICEVRRCQRSATKLMIVKTKDRLGNNVAAEYSFCEKHLEQFKKELRGSTPSS